MVVIRREEAHTDGVRRIRVLSADQLGKVVKLMGQRPFLLLN